MTIDQGQTPGFRFVLQGRTNYEKAFIVMLAAHGHIALGQVAEHDNQIYLFQGVSR